jgi:hypothetical protein
VLPEGSTGPEDSYARTGSLSGTTWIVVLGLAAQLCLLAIVAAYPDTAAGGVCWHDPAAGSVRFFDLCLFLSLGVSALLLGFLVATRAWLLVVTAGPVSLVVLAATWAAEGARSCT